MSTSRGGPPSGPSNHTSPRSTSPHYRKLYTNNSGAGSGSASSGNSSGFTAEPPRAPRAFREQSHTSTSSNHGVSGGSLSGPSGSQGNGGGGPGSGGGYQRTSYNPSQGGQSSPGSGYHHGGYHAGGGSGPPHAKGRGGSDLSGPPHGPRGRGGPGALPLSTSSGAHIPPSTRSPASVSGGSAGSAYDDRVPMRGDSYRVRQGSMSTYRGRSRERERDWPDYSRASISGGSGPPGPRGSISGYGRIGRSRSRSRDRMDRDRERDRDPRDREIRAIDTNVGGGGMSGPGSGGGYRQRSPRGDRDRELMRDRGHRGSISGGPMGMDYRDRSSNFAPPLPPLDSHRILDRDRERDRDIAMRRSRSRDRIFRERDSRDRDRDRDKERDMLRDRDRDTRYAAAGPKASGSDFYDPSREREQRAREAAEWNRSREAERARFSSNNSNNIEAGSATSPGSASIVTSPTQIHPQRTPSGAYFDHQHQQGQLPRHGNQPPTPGSGQPSSPWPSGRRLMSVGSASNAPPPAPPVSVPRFGFPNVPLKERESQEQRDKDNRSVDNKQATVTTSAPRTDSISRDQQPLKQDRVKAEDVVSIKAESTSSGRRFSPPPPISVPPPSAAGNAPLSGSSSASRGYSPPPPTPNQQHQPYFHQHQTQQPTQQHQQQTTQQQPPPSGPRGVPPTGPRGNNSNAPPPRGPGGFDRDRDRTDIRTGGASKWTSQREKEEPSPQVASYSSPGTSMVHPDRLKGFEIGEKTETLNDRDTHLTNSHSSSSSVPPLRQELKPLQQSQQQQRSQIGLVSSTTGDDDSHETSPASNDNSVVGGDSSLSWNAPQSSRTPANVNIGGTVVHKPHPPHQQTSNRPISAAEKTQHSLSSILNPDGVGSGGVYNFGSSPSVSNSNSSNNLPTSNSVSVPTAAVSGGPGFASGTNISGSIFGNAQTMDSQRSSSQAAPTSSVPCTPTMSISTLAPSASSPQLPPSASSSPQMPVKQVPTGPRAERVNPHLAHGHGHSHASHRGGRGAFWPSPRGGFRGRGGDGPPMAIKREHDDESVPGMGSGYRAGRNSGDWIGGRGRGFDGVGRGAVGRRDARFGSVDRMEGSALGSLGGVAGVVISAVGKGTISGSIMRRNSFGEFETVESGADRAFETGGKTREMEGGKDAEKDKEKNDGARKEKPSSISGDDRMEVKVEKMEGQLQPLTSFPISTPRTFDNNQSLQPQRAESHKPVTSTQPKPVAAAPLPTSQQELAPQSQMIPSVPAEDKMDIDDSDEEVLTLADVVSKMKQIDRELEKWRERLAELDRRKQSCQQELQVLDQEEVLEAKEKEREKERADKERMEATLKQDRIRKEKEEEKQRKEAERRERIKAKEAERMRIEQEREREREREKIEREKAERVERERIERERIERERIERERIERERIERIERERIEKEKIEKDRVEKDRIEKERVEREKIEKERAERERVERERIEKERVERERVEKERERERIERERLEKERLEMEKREQEEMVEEMRKKRENERIEKENAKKAEEDRIEKEREVGKLEQERIAGLDAERIHKEQTEQMKEQAVQLGSESHLEEPQDTEMGNVEAHDSIQAESSVVPPGPELVKIEEDSQGSINTEVPEVLIKFSVDEEVIMTDIPAIPASTKLVDDPDADPDGEFEDDEAFVYDDGETSSRSNQSAGSPNSFVMDDFMIPPPLADGEEPPFKIPTRAELESCLSGLPYLRQGPREPKDYAIYQKTDEAHGKLKPILFTFLQENAKDVYEKEQKLKEEYIDEYEPYLKELRRLENEEQGKKKPGVVGEPPEPDVSPTLVHTAAVVETTTATTTTGRRGGRNAAPTDVVHSEAEMQAIIQILSDQDAQAQADKVKKERSATEAVIPDMILDPLERKLHIFQDYSNLITNDHDRKVCYGTSPPTDEWTETEKQIFTERYMQTPKQWQKIAEHLPGRTYKDCIRHYYLTKKDVGYKEKLRVPKRGKRKGAKARNNAWANGQPQPRTRQSKLITADAARKAAGTPLPPELRVTGDEDEGADSEDVPAPMTDSGRPRRAAAPVFGGDNSVMKPQELSRDDSESATPGPGNGKRSAAGGGGNGNGRLGVAATGDEDSVTEKGSKRARVGNARKEGAKRTRTPAIPLVEKEKTTKEEKRKEELEAKESDAVNALAGLSGLASAVSSKGFEDRTVSAIPMQAPIPLQPLGPQQVAQQIIAAAAPYYNIQPNPPQVQQMPQDQLQFPHQVQSQQQHLQQVIVNPIQQQYDVGDTHPREHKPLMPVAALQPAQSQRGQSQAPTLVAGPTQSLQDMGTGQTTPKKEKQIAQTSSYWSVPEATDFPLLLASYGTNWNLIASHLASKTPTMVKNYYTRQVEGGRHDFRRTAEEANRCLAAGERVPEPPKPTALPKRRYENPHSRSSTAPMEVDNDSILTAQVATVSNFAQQQLPPQHSHPVINTVSSVQGQSSPPPFKPSTVPPSIGSSASSEQRALVPGAQTVSSRKAVAVERPFPQQQSRAATPPVVLPGQMTPKGSVHQSPLHTPQSGKPVQVNAFHDGYIKSSAADREQLQHAKPFQQQHNKQPVVQEQQQQQEIYPKPPSSRQRDKGEERGRERGGEEVYGKQMGHMPKEKMHESLTATERRERDPYSRQQMVQSRDFYTNYGGAQVQDVYSVPPPGHPLPQQDVYAHAVQHPAESHNIPRARKQGQVSESVEGYTIKQEGHSHRRTPSQLSQHDNKQQVHPQSFYGSQPQSQSSTQQKMMQQPVVQQQVVQPQMPIVDRPRAAHSRHASQHDSRPASREATQQIGLEEFHAREERQREIREIQRQREDQERRELIERERERERQERIDRERQEERLERERLERERLERERLERERLERERLERERSERERLERLEREKLERERLERERLERLERERLARERLERERLEREREEMERDRLEGERLERIADRGRQEMETRRREYDLDRAALEREKQDASRGVTPRNVIDLSRERKGIFNIKEMVEPSPAGNRDHRSPVIERETRGYPDLREQHRIEQSREQQRPPIVDARILAEQQQGRERRDWMEQMQQRAVGIPGSRPISATGHHPPSAAGPPSLQQLGRQAVTPNPQIIHPPPPSQKRGSDPQTPLGPPLTPSYQPPSQPAPAPAPATKPARISLTSLLNSDPEPTYTSKPTSAPASHPNPAPQPSQPQQASSQVYPPPPQAPRREPPPSLVEQRPYAYEQRSHIHEQRPHSSIGQRQHQSVETRSQHPSPLEQRPSPLEHRAFAGMEQRLDHRIDQRADQRSPLGVERQAFMDHSRPHTAHDGRQAQIPPPSHPHDRSHVSHERQSYSGMEHRQDAQSQMEQRQHPGTYSSSSTYSSMLNSPGLASKSKPLASPGYQSVPPSAPVETYRPSTRQILNPGHPDNDRSRGYLPQGPPSHPTPPPPQSRPSSIYAPPSQAAGRQEQYSPAYHHARSSSAYVPPPNAPQHHQPPHQQVAQSHPSSRESGSSSMSSHHYQQHPSHLSHAPPSQHHTQQAPPHPSHVHQPPPGPHVQTSRSGYAPGPPTPLSDPQRQPPPPQSGQQYGLHHGHSQVQPQHYPPQGHMGGQPGQSHGTYPGPGGAYEHQAMQRGHERHSRHDSRHERDMRDDRYGRHER